MTPFDYQPATRMIFGEGRFAELGMAACALGFHRTLIVADRGIAAAGYVERAASLLASAGIETARFHDFGENPDTAMVEAGRAFAASAGIDSILGLGGGSSLDCAKGINFVLTNGGNMRDYWGHGKAACAMLPSLAVPTTAGTGSEAQSYALISDAETHVKMACGDSKAAFRAAILDPMLTVSQPFSVTAVTGYDAISHAVESYVTSKRNAVSQCFALEAWRLLAGNYERVLREPGDLEARGAMQIGAHFAGIAIENSMLGATHACANPLTAHYGIPHGVAIAVMLPHVVRWNMESQGALYGALNEADLPGRLALFARAARLPARLRDANVRGESLTAMAGEAAAQWTGKFNPRPFDAEAAIRLYQSAF